MWSKLEATILSVTVCDCVAQVEVTTNGQQFSRSAVQFDYFEPVVSSVSPASGPATNATAVYVLGSHFVRRAERYRCAFGQEIVNGTRVNDSALLCVSAAPSPAGAVPLEVSLNGREYTADGVLFTYAPGPHVVHRRAVHLPLGALRSPCAMCGTGTLRCRPSRPSRRR